MYGILYIYNNIVFQPLYQILDTSQSYLGVCVLKFKLPIVNDSIEYNNEQNKSDGYSLKDGKKSTRTEEQMVYKGNISKKKLTKSMFHTKSFHRNWFS